MRVGDLVERSWPADPGRIGLLVDRVPKDISRGVTTRDWFVVHWTDGVRDMVRSQFLKVVK